MANRSTATQTQAGSAVPMLPRRSLGLKLLLVCALAFLMSVPALFVFALLMDRTDRAGTVAAEVGGLMGGPQTFLGPVLAVPYARPAAAPVTQPGTALTSAAVSNGVWHIFPTQGRVEVTSESELRRRSLFRVPVYQAQVRYSASFDLEQAGEDAPRGVVLDWGRAELLVGASDARGAQSDIGLAIAGRPSVSLTPSLIEPQADLASGEDPYQAAIPVMRRLTLFGTPLTPEDRARPVLQVEGQAAFSGAQRIAVLAFARTTQASIRGDWAHPSYNGGFLPVRQGAEAGSQGQGFAADWTVPFVARGVPEESAGLAGLGATELGVTFVEPANPYQSVSRSLKYAPMFIGLVFLAFFLFETSTGRRVHPAQYVLIGLAQVIFYMLLLSIAEHTGFDIAFLIAAVATVGLISAYTGWTFESRAQGLRGLIAFAFLYGLIYVLMRLEDYALLVGAVTSFAAIAAAMYFTRKLDWYGMIGTDRAGQDTRGPQ